MAIFTKYKKIFLLVGILTAVVLIYELFFSSGGGGAQATDALNPTLGGLVSSLSVSSGDSIIGRELLTMLLKLKSIVLDTTVFDSKVFSSLQDWSQPIAPQPFGKTVGRRNPFSDFGDTSVETGTASSVPSNAFGSPSVAR